MSMSPHRAALPASPEAEARAQSRQLLAVQDAVPRELAGRTKQSKLYPRMLNAASALRSPATREDALAFLRAHAGSVAGLYGLLKKPYGPQKEHSCLPEAALLILRVALPGMVALGPQDAAAAEKMRNASFDQLRALGLDESMQRLYTQVSQALLDRAAGNPAQAAQRYEQALKEPALDGVSKMFRLELCEAAQQAAAEALERRKAPEDAQQAGAMRALADQAATEADSLLAQAADELPDLVSDRLEAVLGRPARCYANIFAPYRERLEQMISDQVQQEGGAEGAVVLAAGLASMYEVPELHAHAPSLMKRVAPVLEQVKDEVRAWALLAFARLSHIAGASAEAGVSAQTCLQSAVRLVQQQGAAVEAEILELALQVAGLLGAKEELALLRVVQADKTALKGDGLAADFQCAEALFDAPGSQAVRDMLAQVFGMDEEALQGLPERALAAGSDKPRLAVRLVTKALVTLHHDVPRALDMVDTVDAMARSVQPLDRALFDLELGRFSHKMSPGDPEALRRVETALKVLVNTPDARVWQGAQETALEIAAHHEALPDMQLKLLRFNLQSARWDDAQRLFEQASKAASGSEGKPKDEAVLCELLDLAAEAEFRRNNHEAGVRRLSMANNRRAALQLARDPKDRGTALLLERQRRAAEKALDRLDQQDSEYIERQVTQDSQYIEQQVPFPDRPAHLQKLEGGRYQKIVESADEGDDLIKAWCERPAPPRPA